MYGELFVMASISFLNLSINIPGFVSYLLCVGNKCISTHGLILVRRLKKVYVTFKKYIRN